MLNSFSDLAETLGPPLITKVGSVHGLNVAKFQKKKRLFNHEIHVAMKRIPHPKRNSTSSSKNVKKHSNNEKYFNVAPQLKIKR